MQQYEQDKLITEMQSTIKELEHMSDSMQIEINQKEELNVLLKNENEKLIHELTPLRQNY